LVYGSTFTVVAGSKGLPGLPLTSSGYVYTFCMYENENFQKRKFEGRADSRIDPTFGAGGGNR